ncbi:Gmad2 immunoglobulin-like domain-containing protein [Actinoplanes xinjiangensis]|uniref:Sporulation and spore germination protein n=2 Tax=Actinoplanes xinjiangensis TaxID=512350 RepID=A0A316F2W9_9ACTN|nr:Gmad2 immunoglobulin-like domain-containing protein [Actinoplanes xinjiangensis]PWK39430.1 sporulation and spore germination protein [Actinoplanes xinjiangensis]
MNVSTRTRWMTAAVSAFVAAAMVLSGIWLAVRDNATGGTAPPVAGAPAIPGPSESPSSEPGTAPTMMTVKVYFHRGPADDPTKVVAVRRSVPRSPKVATAALTQLLAGPTQAERAAGYWSVFTSATAGKLRSVRIADAVGYADFNDLRPVMPTAGSSAGTAAFLAELDTTFKQFATVHRTIYSLDGDVATFYEWLQLSPPENTMPPLAEAQRVARVWLAQVAGMRNIAVQGSQWRSDFIATVDIRTRVGEGRSVSGPLSRVLLGKTRTSFTVLGVITDTIVVDRPAAAITLSDLAVVTSPLTISGRALAFEGNINIRVVQIHNGTVRELAVGHVTGGGDVMRPFTGQIAFTTPSTDTGWVLASEPSAYNGAVTKVTAVRVAFTHLPG